MGTHPGVIDCVSLGYQVCNSFKALVLNPKSPAAPSGRNDRCSPSSGRKNVNCGGIGLARVVENGHDARPAKISGQGCSRTSQAFGWFGLFDPIDPVLAVGCVPGDEMMIMRLRMFAASLVMAAAIGQAGCSIVAAAAGGGESATRPSADYETVWKTTVAVLDEYFDIATENRLAHTIVTQPKNGATLLEPWNGDSVGFNERLESTMQTIRRFARATITQALSGGYVVKVEVHKELEDLARPERSAAGRAVFNNDFPINRSREIVGPCRFPMVGSA